MADIITVPTQVLAATEANYIAYFQGFACLPRIEFHQDAAMTWFIANGPPGNAVLCTQVTPAQADAKIDAMLAYLATRVHRSSWWQVLPSSAPPDLAQRLLTHGLTPTESRPVMTLDLAALTAPPTPATLRIERVNDEAALRRWHVASAAGFESSLQDTQPYFDAYACLGFAPDAASQHYIGYVDDVAVTSATLLLAGGIAGVYDVSTIPTARRQGFGAAITTTMLHAAHQRGYRYAVLQASEEGYGVYQRLGFVTQYHEANYLWQKAGG